MNTTRTLLDMAAKALGGRGTVGAGGSRARGRAAPRTPSRGLNRLADDLSGSLDDFHVGSFNIALGAVTALVIGAAFVVPALSKKGK